VNVLLEPAGGGARPDRFQQLGVAGLCPAAGAVADLPLDRGEVAAVNPSRGAICWSVATLAIAGLLLWTDRK
jgi:hypothetical protein